MHNPAGRRIFHAVVLILFVFSLFSVPIAKPVQAVGEERPPQESAGRPLAVAAPSIELNLPAQGLVGESVDFSVSFDNESADEGYGPFIEVYLDVTGTDGSFPGDTEANRYDGLGTTSIEYFYGGNPIQPTDVWEVQLGLNGEAPHPILRDSNGNYVTMSAPGFVQGDKVVVIRLPFGSFVPDQPAAVVDFSVDMSILADLNSPLRVAARGGYQFGGTPLDDWCCDAETMSTWSSLISSTITPTLLTLSKANDAAENETATGPDFPRTYTIMINGPLGQTITGLGITDVLPANVQFAGSVGGPHLNSCSETPSLTVPGGRLVCALNNFSGSTSLSFAFYVPRLDSAGDAVIDPNDGDDELACNQAEATGNWTPVDPRDSAGPTTVGGVADGTCENSLDVKSIAVQKGVSIVTDTGATGASPGDTLEYTLNFQVSDYFAFQGVTLDDRFSDGQHFDSSFVPTLTFNGNNDITTSGNFNAANYVVQCQYSNPGTECEINLPLVVPDNPADPVNGSTTVRFNVSDELIQRAITGNLIGGCIPAGGTGGGEPDCDVYRNGPTTGTITFRTIIQENFTDTYPSGDISVDQGDILRNTVAVNGQLLNVVDLTTTGMETEADTSGASVSIARGTFTKSIYALNGNTTFTTPLKITVGDRVTYRLEYTLITSDVEDMTFTDYFPLPIFDVDDPDADGVDNPAPVWSFDPTVSGDVPVAGQVKFGPGDTFYNYSNSVPSVTADSAGNSVEVKYLDFDDPRNLPTKVDLLFTVTVTDKPFADGLYLTNQASVYEDSTNAEDVTSNAIVQVLFTAPAVYGNKSVVATDGDGILNPALQDPSGNAWVDPGTTGPRWGGTINSNWLESNPINSNLDDADAGDLVTFAITLENRGTGIKGAFDMVIKDALDSVHFGYPGGDSANLNLQVYYGNGSGPISFTDINDGVLSSDAAIANAFFGTGIKLVDPNINQGVCDAYDETLGNNVIVITYDLQLTTGAEAGETYTNMATLVNYAGQEGGTNFVPDGEDYTAEVKIDQPEITKTLVSTSIEGTPNNDRTHAVIGEIVTYQVVINDVPEGTLENLTLTDALDSGLAFVGVESVTASSTDVTTSLTTGFGAAANPPTNPVVAAPGQSVVFDLGTVTNANTDNAVEETITIVYTAVVLNTIGNNAGGRLNNAVTLTWAVDDLTWPTAAAPDVTILEPRLTVAKGASPSSGFDAGDTINYTITITNGSGANDTDAYDLRITDVIPAGLTYTATTLATTCTDGTVVDTDPVNLSVTASALLKGASCTVSYAVTVDAGVTPNQTFTNEVDLTWTSLPEDNATNLSPYNDTDDDERNGDGGKNDYAAETNRPVNSEPYSVVKTLVSTSEAHTAGSNVTIGEIIRYRLQVLIPEGDSPQFVIRDLLPNGQTFIDETQVNVGIVAENAFTSVALDEVPALSGACLIGDTNAALTCTLADGNINHNYNTDNNEDLFSNSIDVYFRLGDLTNNDRDVNDEYVIIEFNALVNNTQNTATPPVSNNNAGNTRANSARAFKNGNTQVGIDSNSVTVTIVEPQLTINKSVAPATADAGDAVVYYLDITNGNTNASTAFDLVVNDVINEYMVVQSISTGSVPSVTPNDSTCMGGETFTVSGLTPARQNISLGITCLDPNRGVRIIIETLVRGDAPSGQTIPNTAYLTWTSLPGTGTTGNPTTTNTPGDSGDADGERNGSGTGANDYADNSSADLGTAVGLNQATIDKSVTPTSYTIGDLITYRLLVTLAEGNTVNLVVDDNIPAGFDYEAHRIITTTTADTSGLLSADYGGSLNTPTVTNVDGDGEDIKFEFGTQTTTADNNPDNNAFLIELDVRVLNVFTSGDANTNYDGLTKTNTVTLDHANNSPVSDSVNVTLVEPEITTTKQVALHEGSSVWQAGAVLDYTVRFENTGNSTAYDVTARDDLAQGVSYNTGSMMCQLLAADNSTIRSLPVTVDNQTTYLLISGTDGDWDVSVGQKIECGYAATVLDTAHIDGAHTNTVDADWSSLDGTPTIERTYNDGPAYLVDGTQDTNTAAFNIAAPSITKTVSPATPTIGDTVTFTVVITSPYGTLRDLEIVDTLPAGMVFVPGSVTVLNGLTFGAPSISDQDLTWTLGDPVINSGNATSRFTFQAIVENVIGNQAGLNLENSVNLNYTDAQGVARALTDTADVDLVEPQMAVIKTNNATATMDAGDTVTYTLTVTNPSTNANNTTAYDILITDQVYPGTTITVDSITPGGGVDISHVTDNSSGNSLSITVTSFPVDGQLVVIYTITLPDSIVPNEAIDNAVDLTWTSTAGANVNERTGAGGPLNDYAAQDDTSFNINTVAISKSISASSASHTSGANLTIGEVATFEILVTFPDGTIPAPLAIVDTLPLGFSVLSGTVIVDTSGLDSTLGTGTTTVDTTTFDYEVLQIDYADPFVVSSAVGSGNVLRITYDAVVKNDTINNLNGNTKQNAASVQWGGGTPLAATPVEMTILEPNLQVSKTVDDVQPGLGDTVNYTITLSHTAASATNAMDITISDVIPAGLTYVDGTIGVSCPSGTLTSSDTASPTLTWTVDNLPVGQNCTLNFQATVDVATPGTLITNSVTVNYSTLPGTPAEERSYQTENSVDLTAFTPDLRIEKTDSDAAGVPGGNITYTITYRNDGNIQATGVVLTETVPAYTTFNDAETTSAWVCGGITAGSTCTLTVGTLAVGASGSADFVVTVNASIPAAIAQTTNTVSIQDDGTQGTDPTPANNEDSENTPLTAAPDLNLQKTDSDSTATPGNAIVYTLTYQNVGNQDATGVVITETVPQHTTYTTTGSTPGWVCTPDASADSSCALEISGVVAAGSSASVTFAVVVDAPLAAGIREIYNFATVADDGENGDDLTEDNWAEETTPVTAEPILTITKVDDVDPTTPGSTIVYTITYDNVGDQTATGVVITETVPTYTTFNADLSDDRWSCSDGDPAGTVCTISLASLAVGGGVGDPIDFAVNVAATVPALVTQIDNTVIIADDGANSEDDLSKTDDDDEVTLLTAAPDLSVTKEDGVDLVQVGKVLTYTITYANVGNQDATGVVITESVPDYTTYFTRPSDPIAWVCTGSVAGSDCTYTVGALAAGVSGTVEFELLVNNPVPAGVHTIVNAVLIADDGENGEEVDYTNNEDEETTPLDALPDLSIDKDDRGESVLPGESIEYDLAYANLGQQDATGVVITETVPDYTSFDAAHSDAAWVCDAVTAGSTCTFAVGDLAAGDTGSIRFAVLVENPLTAGVNSILNNVSIKDDGNNGEDSNPDNNADDEDTPVEAGSDLTITKEDGVVQVSPGEALTYTIVVRNVGSQSASGVVVTDTLPEGVVFVSASNGGTLDAATREITWNLGVVAGESEVTLTVEVAVEDPFTGLDSEIVNQVIVEDDGSNGVDPTPENNEDDDRDLISDSAKVIRDTNQEHTTGIDAAVGEVITYAVTLDLAPGLVEDLVFTDVVDQGLAFIGCSQITTDPADALTLQPGYTLPGLCSMAAVTRYPATSSDLVDDGRQMVINFGDVNNTTNADITLTVLYDVVVLNTEANQDGQSLGNQAAWRWKGGSLEAAASPLTVVEPDLVISKTVSPQTAFSNQYITYTVTIQHTPESQADAFNLVLSDTLPTALTYVPGSLKFVSGQLPSLINDLNPPFLRVSWDVFTRTSEPTVLTYQARVTGGSPGARIENQVNLDWSSLPGVVAAPLSPYNAASVERAYTPGSNVNVYGVAANAVLNIPYLPQTGFAPGVRTVLPPQPDSAAYQALDDLRFAIPKQNLDLPIVGVPLAADGWDLTWLSSQVGYLEGTAYPTWEGNTGLTAHVYNADGTPGPFVNLHLLRWGDRVQVTAFGQVFTYEVRSVERVAAYDLSVLRHEDRSWLTLITCQSFDESTQQYTWRVVVRAVLVSVEAIP